MKRESKTVLVMVFFFVSLLSATITGTSAAEYKSLKGQEAVKAVFDFRDGDPESAVVHLRLVHQTFKDKAITAVTKSPSFVVIFMDSSVKLISKQREGFSPEQQKMLDEFAGTISEMSKDGIDLEVCLFAANFFNVDPGSIPTEIRQVDNGWISLIGYQADGYSLVPAY